MDFLLLLLCTISKFIISADILIWMFGIGTPIQSLLITRHSFEGDYVRFRWTRSGMHFPNTTLYGRFQWTWTRFTYTVRVSWVVLTKFIGEPSSWNLRKIKIIYPLLSSSSARVWWPFGRWNEAVWLSQDILLLCAVLFATLRFHGVSQTNGP